MSRKTPGLRICLTAVTLCLTISLSISAYGQTDTVAPPATPAANAAGNAEVEKIMQTFQGKGVITDDSKPTPAADAVKLFQLEPDLKIDLLASEPDVRQPLFMWFDERERLWLLEYLQYPFPAGLKVVRYDQYLRAVFDNVPKPPPHHVPGLDKISVFEDTDGDGKFDSHREVITGLNIATAVVTGRGGIWVMNAPYLLFYPDADGDDIPDGPPQVKLSGFGLQDTHAVGNSLQWGQDGWLYGANGSTTTCDITSKASNVRFEGQCIWRFHPETEVFEIYAEGGGNTFSLEFDADGRVFSGTNHGNTRGMYYPQGSYGEKNFGKHGPLSNPYAFGNFLHMAHQGDKDRFPQTFVIYDGHTLPARYQHQIIAANALHNRVWASKMSPDGSTYQTVDMPVVCTTPDHWFRPVDVKVGPDGGVYLADWYDSRLSHVDPRDTWHKGSGRLYRIQAQDAKPHQPVNFGKLTDSQLIEYFSHPNKWQRQTAVRVLGERLLRQGDTPPTQKTLANLKALCLKDNPTALEALWVVNMGHGLDDTLAAQLLKHPDPSVRRWTVRLLGDHRQVSTAIGSELARLAHSEPDVQVRSQLASTARRLETSLALPIVDGLLVHTDDLQDPHMPLLLWWVLETHCGEQILNRSPHVGVALSPTETTPPRDQLINWLKQNQHWQSPFFTQSLTTKLMRRLALENAALPTEKRNWAACEQLLAAAPNPEVRQQLLAGFLEATQGQKLTALPADLDKAVREHQAQLGKSDTVLGMQLGQEEAIKTGLAQIKNNATDLSLRLVLIETCGQVKIPDSVPVLTSLLRSPTAALRKAALLALVAYQDPQIAKNILSAYQVTLTDEDGQREAAFRVLASRPEWTAQLLTEIAEFRINAASVPVDVVQQMRLHTQPELQKQIDKIWGRVRETNAEKKVEIERLRKLIQAARQLDAPKLPDRQLGQALFREHCGTCHTLFGAGGAVGPNLTGYERSNLDFMLLAIVDPSAGIREEFTQFQVVTVDGRIQTGLLTDQTPLTVTVKSVNGQTSVIPRDDIEVLQGMQTSIMPEGLTQRLTDKQVVALFQYLMAPAPTE